MIPEVTQRRQAPGPPRSLLAPRGSWPDAPLVESSLSPAVQAACAAAAEVAVELERALRTVSVAAIARDADVARSTIYDLLSGATWPDIVTLYKLEAALGVELWGRRPKRRTRTR